MVGWNSGAAPAVDGAEPSSPAARCGGILVRPRPDGAEELVNRSCGRGFWEMSWKPSVFRMDVVFATGSPPTAGPAPELQPTTADYNRRVRLGKDEPDFC